ncbi:MAG: DNA polymerase III subunit delta [Gemmatimonadota bacterium]
MPAVTISAFKAAVTKGPLAPVYLFHGSDDFLKEDWVRRLTEAATDPGTRDFNLELLRGAECDAAQLGRALDALPMLADRRLVILRDPSALKKPARERLTKALTNPAADTVLLLVAPSSAKIEKEWMELAASVEFAALDGKDLLKWIAVTAEKQVGATITPSAATLLASYGGNDLALLSGELRKLAAFTNGEPIDESAIEAVTGVRPGRTLSELLDHVAARRTTEAIALVDEVLAQPKMGGVPLVMALTTQTLGIGWAVAARARGVAASRLEGELFSLLKQSGGAYTGCAWGEAVSRWARSLTAWNAGDIDRALAALLAADRALKDTKVSSEEQIVTSLLLAMAPTMRGRKAA